MRFNLIKKMTGFLFTATVLGGICVAGENAKVKELVDSQYYEALVKSGIVSEYRDDGSKEFKLLPKSFYSEKITSSMIEKQPKNYPYTYEGLYLLNKKELLANGSSGKNTITLDDVSVVVRSISKMEGMKYYSSTKKKETVLYEKTYMIAGPNDKTKIADQNTGNADGQVSYCIQDDNSFGVNTYQLSYFQKDDCLLCKFDILDKMGIGPFKAIYPGKMMINILVIDCGDDLLLYLCTDLDSVKFPGIKAQITDSMSARMDAVYKWFIKQF
ncbi:MAG: hypothetical protein J6X84_00115 [Treponema sp.]|nr:hypothetical protein [Treponema sp.]